MPFEVVEVQLMTQQALNPRTDSLRDCTLNWGIFFIYLFFQNTVTIPCMQKLLCGIDYKELLMPKKPHQP